MSIPLRHPAKLPLSLPRIRGRVFQDSFNRYRANTAPAFPWRVFGNTVTVLPESILRINDEDPGSLVIARADLSPSPYPMLMETGLLEFEMILIAVANGAIIDLLDADLNTRFHLAVSPTLDFRWYNGAAWQEFTIPTDLSLNEWYLIRLEWNTRRNLCRTYVNNRYIGDAGIWEAGGAIRYAPSFASGSTPGTGDVFDIKYVKVERLA